MIIREASEVPHNAGEFFEIAAVLIRLGSRVNYVISLFFSVESDSGVKTTVKPQMEDLGFTHGHSG